MKFKNILNKYRILTDGKYYVFDSKSPIIMYEIFNPKLIHVVNFIGLTENEELAESGYMTMVRDSDELEKQIGKLYREWEEVKLQLKQNKINESIKEMEKDFE